MTTKTAIHRNNNKNQGTPEWYTPTWLVNRIAAFLGDDWYDPCPASRGKVIENGLTATWKGKRVFCNPPYGRPLGAWITKAMTEQTRELILLVPAYTDTRWFAPLFHDSTICFIYGRLRFMVHGIMPADAPHASVLVYRGRRHKVFAEAFSDLGPVVRTYRAKRDAQPRLLEVPA